MRKKFTSNLVFAFVAQFVSMCSSIMISLILPKMLGVEQFAYWQLFIFYSGYVGLFHFGLSDGIYLRYGGQPLKDMDKSVIGSQFRFMVVWQVIISLAAIVVLPFFVKDSMRLFIWQITCIYLVTANATWCLGYIFQAGNETKLYSIACMLSKLLFILYIIFSWYSKNTNLKLLICAFVGTQIISMVYSVVAGREFVFSKQCRLQVCIREICNNIRIGIILTFSNIASSLILGIGKAFVDGYWDIKSFGIFTLAISLVNFILQFIQQVSIVMFPMLRQIDSERRKSLFCLLREIMGIVLCGVLVLYVPIKMILVMWLPQYKESLEYLGILLPMCIFDGKMQMLYNTYLKTLRKEKVLLLINVISCGVSLMLCLGSTLVFDSVILVVFSMILSVMIRSIIASVYLSKEMKIPFEKGIWIELLLVIQFICFNMCFPSVVSFVAYVLVYGLFILSKRHKIKGFISNQGILRNKQICN